MNTGGPGFYRGTTHEQMPFFANKEKRLIENRKWSPCFEKPVDMSKVSIGVIKHWISKRITELLGVEDEIVIDFCMTQLLPGDSKSEEDGADKVDPRKLQINMTGFLGKKAGQFVTELWQHLLSAQDSLDGVPQTLLQQTKDDLERRKQETDRARKALEEKEAAILALNQKSEIHGHGKTSGRTDQDVLMSKTSESSSGRNRQHTKRGASPSQSSMRRAESKSSPRTPLSEAEKNKSVFSRMTSLEGEKSSRPDRREAYQTRNSRETESNENFKHADSRVFQYGPNSRRRRSSSSPPRRQNRWRRSSSRSSEGFSRRSARIENGTLNGGTDRRTAVAQQSPFVSRMRGGRNLSSPNNRRHSATRPGRVHSFGTDDSRMSRSSSTEKRASRRLSSRDAVRAVQNNKGISNWNQRKEPRESSSRGNYPSEQSTRNRYEKSWGRNAQDRNDRHVDGHCRRGDSRELIFEERREKFRAAARYDAMRRRLSSSGAKRKLDDETDTLDKRRRVNGRIRSKGSFSEELDSHLTSDGRGRSSRYTRGQDAPRDSMCGNEKTRKTGKNEYYNDRDYSRRDKNWNGQGRLRGWSSEGDA